jgi:bacteriorhodopsin
MEMECNKSLGMFYTLLYILVVILAGIVINDGKSEKKMVSWTLYAFGIIFGLITIAIIFVNKCKKKTEGNALRKGTSTNIRKYVPIIFTFIFSIGNLIAMIIAKPDLPVSQLFVPHFINIVLLLSSIFIGLSGCS